MPLSKLPTSGLDDVNQRRRHVETLNNVLDFTFDDSRVRTRAESAALMTPVNYAYAPGSVLRAGAKGDGATDDTAAFQRALDALPAYGRLIIPMPDVSYVIGGNLTVNGRKSIYTEGLPLILHGGNGHCFEITGSSGSTNQYIGDMEIQGTSSGLSGIYANGANNGPHEFRNLFIHDYSGATAACIRMNDAYAYQIGLCWLRDSSYGILAEAGNGVNEVYVTRNHFTTLSVCAVDIRQGNHWRTATNFTAGPSTSAIGFRVGLNNTSGEPCTDIELLAEEFEGSYDICVDVGPGATNACRGIAVVRPEYDVVTANLGSHYSRFQNTVGLEIKMLGRVGALAGAKKWYTIASTVSSALITDIAYNSAQSTILASTYRLITQDRIDGTSQEVENPILAQRLVMSGILSPAQITSNQNNYNPAGFGTCNVLRINSDAARDITGLVASANSQTLLVLNSGGFPITLKHESASSTAVNRFTFASGNDLILNRTGMMWLFYDQTNARWFGSLAT